MPGRVVRIRELGSGLAVIALSTALGAATADAGTSVLELDLEKSRVSFSLDSTLHRINGSARLAYARATFDPAGGEASGRFVIDAASTDTNNGLRDRKMHQKVLESDRFDEIVFVPTSLEVGEIDGNRAAVTLAGWIDIHGMEWPLRIPATVTVQGERIHIEGRFTIPYVEWGMKDVGNFLLHVDPEVEVALDAVGTVRPPLSP